MVLSTVDVDVSTRALRRPCHLGQAPEQLGHLQVVAHQRHPTQVAELFQGLVAGLSEPPAAADVARIEGLFGPQVQERGL